MDDIDIVVSSNTEIISGEHTICTPGTIDSHITLYLTTAGN